jgi:hypothetical protein
MKKETPGKREDEPLLPPESRANDDIYKHKTKATPATPLLLYAFAAGYAPITSAGPLQAVVESLQNAASGATRWEESKRQTLSYRSSKPLGQTIVEYGDMERLTMLKDETRGQFWNEVKSFDDYDVDVLLAIMAQIIKQGEQPAWFGASQFLDNRDLMPMMKKEGSTFRRAGHRREDIDRVREALLRLSQLRIHIEEATPPEQRGQPRGKYVYHGPVFLIEDIWKQKAERRVVEQNEADKQYPLAWRVRAGDWLTEYMKRPRTMALLSEKSLHYHVTKEMWPKRLSRYCLFHLPHRKGQTKSMITRHVGSIMHDMSLPLDARNPERTRERFERALNMLVEDQLIGAWQYKEQPKLPSKNWFPNFQEWQIQIFSLAHL